MVEAGILLVLDAILIGGGLALWRVLRGPTRGGQGRALRATVLALFVVPLVGVGAWQLSKARAFQFFGGIVTRVETAERVVALTFDDGPSAEYTAEVLSILRDHDVRATFYLVGQAIEAHPAACQQIVADGHEVGNHSYAHRQMIFQPWSFVRGEIERADRLIRECGYEGDIHFRSPYGKKLLVLPHYLHNTGRLNIFYDVEPESYPEIASDADRIVAHVLAETSPGSIILLHVMPDPRAATRVALPGVIQGLQDRGYRFVTVSELLALGTW